MANYPSWTLHQYTQDMLSPNRTVDRTIDSGRVDTFREHYAQYLESVQNQGTRPTEIRDASDVRAAQRQNNQSANEARTLLRQLELVRGNIGEDAYQSMRRSLTGSVQAANTNNRNLRSVRREMQEQKEAGRRAQEQAQAQKEALQGFQSRYNAFADKAKTQKKDLPDLQQYQSQETLSNAKENNDYLASLSEELIRQWDSMQGYVDQDTYNEMKDTLTNAQSSIQNNSEVLDSAKAFYGQFENRSDYDWYIYTSGKADWSYDQLDAEYNRVKDTNTRKAEWVKNQRDSKMTSEDIEAKINELEAEVVAADAVLADTQPVKKIEKYGMEFIEGAEPPDDKEKYALDSGFKQLPEDVSEEELAQRREEAAQKKEELAYWKNRLTEVQKQEEEQAKIDSALDGYTNDKQDWSYEEYEVEKEKLQGIANEKADAGEDDSQERYRIDWLDQRMVEIGDTMIADYTQDKQELTYSEYETEYEKVTANLQKKLANDEDATYEKAQQSWLERQMNSVVTFDDAQKKINVYQNEMEQSDKQMQEVLHALYQMNPALGSIGEIVECSEDDNGFTIKYKTKSNIGIGNTVFSKKISKEEYALAEQYIDAKERKEEAQNQVDEWTTTQETLKTTQKIREIKERPDFYTITQPQAEKMKSDERYNEIAGMYDYWEKTGGTDYHGYASGNMDEMTSDEMRTYIGLYNLYGEEAANEYYDDLSPMLKQRNIQRIQESVSEFMGDMQDIPILGDIANGVATLASVGTSLLSGVYYIEQAIGGVLGFDSDVFAFLPAVTSGVRESVMDDYDLTIGGVDVFDLAYGIGTSTLDTLGAVAIGTALAPVTGGASTTIMPATMLGLSAASQTYQDGIARGMGKGQALLSGFVAGALETIFEQIPIGKFLDEGADVARALSRSGIGKAGFRETAKAFGKSAFLNASEEMLTETANIAYDTLVNGEYSNYAQAVQLYVSDGLNEQQAKSKAMSDMLWQVAQSGISGAAGGVVFGGINQYKVRRKFKALGEAVTEHTGRQIEGRNSAENLLETAKGMKGLSEIYSQTKEAVANNPDSGKTTKLLGRLFYAVEDSVKQNAKSNVHNAAGERLRKLGLDKEKAEKGAAILEQVYSGEKLNRKQERFIAENGQVKQALEEMITAKRHAELLGEQYNPKKAGYRNETGFDNRWYHEALGDLEGKRRALLGVIEPNWEEQMWQSMFSTRQTEQNAKALQPELQRLGLNADQAGNVANLIAKYIENGSLNPTEVNYLNRNADVRDAFNAIVGENDITGFQWKTDTGTADGDLQQQLGQDTTGFDNAQAVITDPTTGEVMDSGLDGQDSLNIPEMQNPDDTSTLQENSVENSLQDDIMNNRIHQIKKSKLEYVPTSGVEIKATPGKTTTIIGSYV